MPFKSHVTRQSQAIDGKSKPYRFLKPVRFECVVKKDLPQQSQIHFCSAVDEYYIQTSIG